MYALQVRTGRERDVIAELHGMGYVSYVPAELRQERQGGRWHQRRHTLMPGYVFVDTDLSATDYYCIRSVPVVVDFIRCGQTAPIPLLPDEAALIRDWSMDVMETSVVELGDGDAVRVVRGPLMGREGMILHVDRRHKRVTVEITVHGQPRAVQLSAEVVRVHTATA
jgi:transcriptional antiterminator NusG